MLLSVNWLRDYLLKPDTKIDPKELSEKLTMRGLQVASVKRSSHGLDSVVVGRIEKIDKHPNADRLQVTSVITSSAPDAAPRQIVCGATNISVGDYVPVALPGANLPGDLKIKMSTIRGVESFGMICSGKELGLSDESEGILQLPKHSTLGEDVGRMLGGGNDDILLEFELTPNRGDCLSMLGLTREIAPILHTRLREPKPPKFRISPHRTSAIIKVDVDDPVLCPRYVARVMDTLKITESPEWIKQRLQAVGLKPINNVVDVTNFVMLEYGQPLHAFDLRRIESSSIRIGPCKAQMDFTLLNGQTVQLEPGDILIMDGERPIALAGIMGGANSQITADTTSIVLESAAFNPSQIRRTAKRLGLVSDSSKRFEKGVDIMGVAYASERAAALLRDSFNANVYHPPIDTNEHGVKEQLLAVDMRDVRKIIGVQISAEQVAELLEQMGITSHKKSVNVLSIRLPTYRTDLKESIDIIEEVARLGGYDRIPEKMPAAGAAFNRFDESPYEFECRVRELLTHEGLQETIHYSFTSEELFRKYGMKRDEAIFLKNPISDEMKMMRTSLLPSLLTTYQFNRNRKVEDQRFFEVARVYVKDEQEETKAKETLHLAGLISGHQLPVNWRGPGPEVDFFFLKGLLEALTRDLTSVYLAYEPLKNHPMLHPARSATLKLGVREIGCVGELHPHLKKNLVETTEPVVLFELNLDALRKYERNTVRYKPPSKFPAVDVDLAFTLDTSLSSHSIIESMKVTAGPLLQKIKVFDLYQGDNIPSGKKSLAFRLTFGSNEKTLLDEEVVSIKTKIIDSVSEKFGGQLRA